MLKYGGRWQDCLADYGLSTAVYNRWNRSSRWGVWGRILAALTDERWIAETVKIDRSHVKAHRCSCSAKGGSGLVRWHLAWRPDYENPRARRPPRQAPRLVLTPDNPPDLKGADLLVGETRVMKRLVTDRLRAKLRDRAASG